MFNMIATTKENAIPLLREAIGQDKDIARIFFTSKLYLLGIEPGVLNSLRDYAVRAHVPDAQTLRHNAVVLTQTAARYPQQVKSLNASLYNKALADRARATRVDV